MVGWIMCRFCCRNLFFSVSVVFCIIGLSCGGVLFCLCWYSMVIMLVCGWLFCVKVMCCSMVCSFSVLVLVSVWWCEGFFGVFVVFMLLF